MLSSRLIDTTNKCDIVKRSLLDDLYPYTISSDGATIQYSAATPPLSPNQTISYNQLSAIGTLATQSYSTINSIDDCWLPIFVDNDTYINNKLLSDEGSYANGNSSLTSGRIGIENFISFSPSFRSFSNVGQMSIDWILNRHNIPYAVYYGIICWVRRNGLTNPMTIGGATAKLETFANGTRLKHSTKPNDVLIKIDNNTLYIVNSQRYTVSATGISYADENNFILQASTLTDSYSLADKVTRETWVPSATTTANETVNGFTIPGLTNNVRLWIPDGDCVFYYASEAEKLLSEVKGIPSNGFISPCLTRYYTNIYRILTLDESRSFAKKDLIRARCYRKLAHALSTSPFISEFAVRALDCSAVKTIVNTYITNSALSTGIATEQTLLKNAIKDISLYLQKTITVGSGTNNTGLYTDTKPSPYSLNNNLIINKNQLFTKLITKYGANLLLSTTSTISINSALLTDNAGVAITQAMDYYSPKGTTNTLLYNNQKIIYDGTTIETEITPTKSRIVIKNTLTGSETQSIPLYDIAKPDIDGANTLFQPKLLYQGYIDRQFMSNGAIYNPVNTNSSYYKYAMKTASSMNDAGFVDTRPELIKGDEQGPELDAMDLLLNVRDQTSLLLHDRYIENQMSFYWEQLSGPDCEFIEENGGFSNTARPSNQTANSRYIRLKIKTSGKYVVQCSINSPYGTFKKQKTIYVYDGAELMEKRTVIGTILRIDYVPNTMQNKWYDENTKTWLPIPTIPANDPEFQPLYLNRDKLRVRCSKFNRVAISQIGSVFMPINTSFTVRSYIGMIGSVPDTEVVKLDDVYKFSTNRSYTPTTSANLSITYSLNSSTTAKISAIYIEKIRSNISGCEQCFSLYEPKLRAYRTTVFTGSSRTNAIRYSRINKQPEGFSLYEYTNITGPGTIEAKELEQVQFGYPNISTDISPPVKTYGGYNNFMINSLGIQNNISTFYNSTIPGLPAPAFSSSDANSIAAATPSVLSPVSGFPLDATNDINPAKHKLCYQRPIPYSGGGPITFTKGVLHPNSGWLFHTASDYAIHANRSSVLKFNPGARSTFSFIGPKISNINALSANVSDKVVEPNTISSAISLRIADGVQWDPACFCGDPAGNWQVETYNKNQEHKEYIDTTTHPSSHGYRYLRGGEPKPYERTALLNLPTYNDEFGTDQEGDKVTYAFAVTGPASLPTEVMGSDGRKHIRIPTVENFGIKDIEIKLNFLNYINTKNLVIWLEVQPDGEETKSRNPDRSGRYASPIKASKKFLDQTVPPTMVSGTLYRSGIDTTNLYSNIPNPKVANYIDTLLNAENDEPNGPLRLLLLNQEHIENNGYNFSIKFSDNASKYNVLCDHNIITGTQNTTSSERPIHSLSIIDKYQKIVKNNDIVRPSLAANAYSDREACQFSKILRNNKLNITAASFSKFYTGSLFKSARPEFGPCPEQAPKVQGPILTGNTTFTLKIMVLDEAEDMSPNDTLISNQYLTGLASANKTQTSTDIFNSLCNWELILHVGEVQKFVPHTNPNLSSYGNCDALSLLDHSKGLKYPGYSFIADLTQYLHLLPLANIDAPNTGIADTSTCITNKNDPIGGGFVVRPTEFPSYAIVQIVASLVPSTTGTLIGTATGPGIGYSQGFNAIVSWLAESRFMGTLEDSGRQIYTQSYTKYPFGSPEKILLNVRKPDSLWYSLEATIMKYHNTPILQLKKHNYMKVQRGVSKYATEFKFNVVTDYQELLDLKNIPEIIYDYSERLPFQQTSVSHPIIKNNLIINHGDLVNVAVTGTVGLGSSGSSLGGLYVALDTGWEKVTDTSLSKLSKTLTNLQNNAVLFYANSLFTDTLQADISGSKVISFATRIPYDIFSIGDTIECYPSSERLSASSSSIIRATILKKGLITKNNTLLSVLVLNTAITDQDRISPTPESNMLLVYSNNTTIDHGVNREYNMWGLDSQGYVKDTTPYAGFSAHSVGSYGNLSPFVNKNLLDKNFKYNRLQSTHEILNNQDNDRIKYNKIALYANNNNILSEVPAFVNDISCGFSYTETDLYDLLVSQTNTNNVAISTENIRQVDGDFGDLSSALLDQIKKTTGHNDKNYSFMYVKTSSITSTTNPITIPTSGMLTIENNFIEHTPIEFIDIDPIVSRLDTIDTLKIQPSLENIIGDPSQTSTVLASSNIKYVKKHLDRLILEDPSSCHRPGAVLTNCPRLRTQNKLHKLYTERSDLLKLLEQQAVAFATVIYEGDSGSRQTISGEILAEGVDYLIIGSSSGRTKILKSTIINDDTEYGLSKTYTRKDLLPDYHIHKLPGSILAKIQPVVTTNSDGSIDIQYNPSNLNHYWINIDPKQSCFLDFASNPKILVSTEYRCIRANESLLNMFTTVRADNNVCPDFADRENVPQFPVDPLGDEGFTSNNDTYKYSIPFATIESTKSSLSRQYPAITGWANYTKERYFNINADNSLGFEGPGTEITVQSTETYLIPQINTALSGNDNSGDVLSLPGIGVCQTGANLGSPGGSGLLGPSENSERVGKPTRVQNIFNLDNINSIEAQIKRVPRMLRGCDLLGTIYRYGNRSLFRPQSSANPRIPFELDGIGRNGPLNNSLYCWVCLQHDTVANRLKYAALPPFFQHQNEMIFRSFFGSIDRIENRSDLMVSYYPWEIIPYEYKG